MASQVGLGDVHLPAQRRLPATLARHDLCSASPSESALAHSSSAASQSPSRRIALARFTIAYTQDVPGTGLADAAHCLLPCFRACRRVGER